MSSTYSSISELYTKPSISFDKTQNSVSMKLRKPTISLSSSQSSKKQNKHNIKKPAISSTTPVKAKKAAKTLSASTNVCTVTQNTPKVSTKKATKKAAKKAAKKATKKATKKAAKKATKKAVKKVVKPPSPKGIGAVSKLAKVAKSVKSKITKSSTILTFVNKYKNRETFEYALIFTILITIFMNKIKRAI